jgi:hypothetical protein
MLLDTAEPFDEELRRDLQRAIARLRLTDVVGALAYAVATAESDEDLVLRLTGALKGQQLLAAQSAQLSQAVIVLTCES